MSQALDLSPRPSALLESLRSIGYTLETALADIFDNSIGASASCVSVHFRWNDGNPWIAVIDDGEGMAADKLVEAMRFGSQSPVLVRDPDDLGRFGLGLKTASISQCRHMTVVTKQRGEVCGCIWDLDLIAKEDSSVWGASFLDRETAESDPLRKTLIDQFLDIKKSGTIVLWRNLEIRLSGATAGSSEKGFSEAMDVARHHLETVFHRFLSPEHGRKAVQMDFNGSALVAFDPFGRPHLARQELTSLPIIVQGERIMVQAYVLPHHSKIPKAEYQQFGGVEGYLQNQGFYVYRNRRLIVKATWFRLIRKEELNKLIRVRIDIPNTVDHLWKLDVKKSQADPPESVRRELRKVIDKIAGAGRRVYTKRATNLMHRSEVPVWRREVADGQVRYRLNEEHPLLHEILEEQDKAGQERLKTCFRLIGGSFPTDLHFADAADDDLEFAPGADEQESEEIVLQLIRALRKSGLEGEVLRKQLLKTETLNASPELIEQLIKQELKNHG